MTKKQILEYFKDINLVYNSCTMHDSLKSMLDELTDDIEFQHSIHVESQEWIPCDERQPDQDGWYLITEWHRGHQQFEVNISLWKADQWWLVDISDKPVAWMPLPEPYIPEKEDESDAI